MLSSLVWTIRRLSARVLLRLVVPAFRISARLVFLKDILDILGLFSGLEGSGLLEPGVFLGLEGSGLEEELLAFIPWSRKLLLLVIRISDSLGLFSGLEGSGLEELELLVVIPWSRKLLLLVIRKRLDKY